MKFILTYDGALVSNGGPQEKWDIRQKLHPQLQQLWQSHPALKALDLHHYVDLDSGYFKVERHHSQDHLFEKGKPSKNCIDLCEPVRRGGRNFLPLVRERLALKCGLRILFLRQEPPGKLVYQGGDLDNRLKTLFDALSVPPHDNQVLGSEPPFDDPIYCLLEDDALILNVNIDTQRLLSRPTAPPNEVRLIIEIDVQVTQSRLYNQPFLGN
jgi:hypothetical protein